MTKLWLDDFRPAPDGWEWVKSVQEAQILLVFEFSTITHASLDHDLGIVNLDAWLAARDEGLAVADPELVEDPNAPTGYDLCLWMAENNIWPSEEIRVHSANPVGAKRMCGVVDRYGPYDVRCQWTPRH